MRKTEYKVDLSVKAIFTEDGQVIPKSIILKDGQTFPIRRITGKCRAACLKAGELGIRYTCELGNYTVQIYLDDYNWYMEAGEYKEFTGVM